MLNESQRIELVKRIRALEAELFPNYPEQILGIKAVEGIINYGLAQNTLFKEGWLEKQVKSKAENHIRNIAHKAGPVEKKMAVKIEAARKASQPSYDPPRRLDALDCQHSIRFTFGKIPDYQEQKNHYRVAFMALGFEFEAHFDKKTWLKFLSQAKKMKFEATVAGELEAESGRGFMLRDVNLMVKYDRKREDHIVQNAASNMIHSPSV